MKNKIFKYLHLLNIFLCFSKLSAYQTYSTKYNSSEYKGYDLFKILEREQRWEEIINTELDTIYRAEYIILKSSKDVFDLTGYSYEVFNKTIGITGYVSYNVTWLRLSNSGMWRNTIHDMDIYVCPGLHIDRLKRPSSENEYLIIADTDSINWMIIHQFNEDTGEFSGLFVLVRNSLSVDKKRIIQENTLTALKGKHENIQAIDVEKSQTIITECTEKRPDHRLQNFGSRNLNNVITNFVLIYLLIFM